MGWFCLMMCVLIICATILFGIYIYCCSQNEVGMFQNMSSYYEKKLSNLEERIKKLENNKGE